MPTIKSKSGTRDNATPTTIKPTGKHAAILKLLKRRKGATIAEIASEIGWQPHSVRGAISGVLKRKHGLQITSAKEGTRGRVYRIAAED